MGKITSWPLKIEGEDGSVEIYDDYPHFKEESGRGISKASVHFRVAETRKKGHFHYEKWIMLNEDKFNELTNRNSKTFTCHYCEQEKPANVYDKIDKKNMKNYVPVDMIDGYMGKQTTVKQCLDCFRRESKRIFADFDKDAWKRKL